MDNILSSLGVDIQSEDLAQKSILKVKILNSIRFVNDQYGVPIVEGSGIIPLISAKSIEKLKLDIKEEISVSISQSQDSIVSYLKLRFLESIVLTKPELSGDQSDSITEVEISPSDTSDQIIGIDTPIEVPMGGNTNKRPSIIRINSHPTLYPESNNSSIFSFREKSETKKNIPQNISYKKINESCKALENEARGIATPLSTIPEEEFNSDINIAATSSSSVSISNNNHSSGSSNVSTTTEERKQRSVNRIIGNGNGVVLGEGVTSYSYHNNNSNNSSNNNDDDVSVKPTTTTFVTCPICQRNIPLLGRSADAVLDKHIDRCMRITSRDNIIAAVPSTSTSQSTPPLASISNSHVGTYKESISVSTNTTSSTTTLTLLRPSTRSQTKMKQNKSVREFDNEDNDDNNDDDGDDCSVYSDRKRRRKSNDMHIQSVNGRGGGGGGYSTRGSQRCNTTGGLVRGRGRRKGSRDVNDDSDSNEDSDEDEDEQTEREEKSSEDTVTADAVGFVNISDDWIERKFVNRLEDASPRVTEVIASFGRDVAVEVDSATWSRLHSYQQTGVSWFWSLFRDGTGGILGDEMGLGKTAQLCSHFDTIGRYIVKTSVGTNATSCGGSCNGGSKASSNSGKLQGRVELGKFLVVCPATLLDHWVREFQAWSPSLRVVVVHRISAAFRDMEETGINVEEVLKEMFCRTINGCMGVVVVSSYEGLRRQRSTLLSIRWTAACLDEGQKIRNPTADITLISKILNAQHRVILSGTPIQNSLKELWSLFDFVCPGRLGTLQAFDREVEVPIRQGGFKSASPLQVEIAVRTAATLQRMLKPYLLRRRKSGDIATSDVVLPKKTEQVLFCRLSATQRLAYLKVIHSDEVSAVLALARRTSAFRAILELRAICNHPHLKIKTIKKMKGSASFMKRLKEEEDMATADGEMLLEGGGDITEEFLEGSGKLLILSKILPLWKAEGHKVLLFTQSLGMLTLLERLVQYLGLSCLRLDGGTPVAKRASLISHYNNDSAIFAMILSTKTGGVGISLTAANRVVLVDPDWNPQTDIQARERAWRLGQKREVTIYRLITRGTIEEKIYQRQIFKVLLSSRILDNPRQKQMFSRSDLKELFTLVEDDGVGEGLPASGSMVLSGHGSYGGNGGETAHPPLANTTLVLANRSISQKVNNSSENDNNDNDHDMSPSVTTVDGNDNGNGNGNETLPPEKAREKRLLKALWDGDAISGVYDHSASEPVNGISSHPNHALIDRTVQAAVRHLNASVVHENISTSTSTASATTTSSDGRGGPNRFGNTRRVLEADRASSSLLSQIRKSHPGAVPNDFTATNTTTSITSTTTININATSSITSTSNRSTSSVGDNDNDNDNDVLFIPVHHTTPEANMLPRLEAIFASANQRYNSQQLLRQFGHLDDRFAPLFRETLRRIARLENGYWVKK